VSAAGLSLNLLHNSSYRQTRIFLFAGFGGLLLLMAILGLSAISSLYRIELREEKIRQEYLVRDRALESLRSNAYVSGTCIRDFLLAADDRLAADSKAQFLQTQDEIESQLAQYQGLVSARAREPFLRFRNDLYSWFEALKPVLQWDAEARRLRGYNFMLEQLSPRRRAVLDSADRVHGVAERDLEESSDAVGAMVSSSRYRLMILMGLTLLTGVILTSVALWRLLRLEEEASQRFQEVLKAREESKRLSVELLSAQETERRRISRELHDEVGQVLSAIALAIGGARSALKSGDRGEVFRELDRVQGMIQQNMGVVRNIALLLRPTMLDDLGLVPALKWLAREFSRDGLVQVDFVADAFLDNLPDEHRTCIFRVVQEAVRNSVRHSGARLVRISLNPLDAAPDCPAIRGSVQDDGKGFEPNQEKGLGLTGMEERVLHLGGRLRVESKPGRGTIVSFELPLARALRNEISIACSCEDSLPHEGDHVQISPFRTA
jgi:signal transduction histidine kinase